MSVAESPIRGVMVPQAFRVGDRAQDTADTFTLTLESMHGAAPTIAPGQFMMVYAFGVGEIPISVSGTSESGEVILTVRAVGAVSQAICDSTPGGVLGMRGPLGTSWPIEVAGGGDVLVVAGGIGLAPLRTLIRHVVRNRQISLQSAFCTERAPRRTCSMSTSWRAGARWPTWRSRSMPRTPVGAAR